MPLPKKFTRVSALSRLRLEMPDINIGVAERRDELRM